MQRVLLTGASGFVGSHVLEHILHTTDYEIVCPVTFTHRGITDRIRLVVGEEYTDRVTVVHCDLSAPISPITDHEFGEIDYVINVASESHVDRSIRYPAPFIINNVALMCHLLDWAVERRLWVRPIQAILQVSTDEVYGPASEGVDHREWEDLHLPSNPYAASKAAQEDIAFAYWRTYNLPIVLTNTMNIIGQRQHPEKFVPQVIKRIVHGDKVIIHGSPEGQPGSRFYLHARNQAHGLMHVLDYVLDAPVNGYVKRGRGLGGLDIPTSTVKLTGESLRYSDGGTKPFRFHIVGEREVDNLEMAQMIESAVIRWTHNNRRGVGISPIDYEVTDFHSARPGHDLRYALDGGKMAAIGWKPPVPLDESLRTTVEWTLEHPEWLEE